MNRTDIEYLDYTLNPLAMRCTPVSEGCTRCWHIRMAKRLAGNPRFPDDVRAAYAGDHEPILIEDRLEEPLRLRKPSRIGIQFMGDLFHEAVFYSTIERVWDMMEATPQHTYLILTKRADNMFATMDSLMVSHGVLPNVWGLVTAENQKQADLRIPLLLQSPFAVRGVSIEPALGAVNLHPYIMHQRDRASGETGRISDYGPALDFVIAGGETGPGARAMDPDWARGVRDQCKAAGVPFFFKQMSNKETIPADLLVREWPGGAE